MLLNCVPESMLGVRENLPFVTGLRARSWNAPVPTEVTYSDRRPRRVPANGPGVCLAGSEALEDGDRQSGFTTFQFLVVLAAVLPGLFQKPVLALLGIQPGPALDQTLDYLPQILCPALLVVVAWIVASLVRFIFKRAMGTTKTGKEESAELESGGILPLPDSLPNVLFWTVFVLFLPVVLVSLGDRRLEEVENSLLQLSPILSTGLVILVFFWLALRIVQRILTSARRASNRKLPWSPNREEDIEESPERKTRIISD